MGSGKGKKSVHREKKNHVIGSAIDLSDVDFCGSDFSDHENQLVN